MFTGIVEETGVLTALDQGAEGVRLTIAARRACQDLALGDSISVDGCCLTAVEAGPEHICFDVLAETLRLTRLAEIAVGAPVNLERSLRYTGKIGGHFVTGHVDTIGRVHVFEARGADYFLEVSVPREFSRYLIYKGSIAINGVSLTVAEAGADRFAVWLIPHTLEKTNLGQLAAGSSVNLEFDLLGKYVERLLPGHRTIDRSAPDLAKPDNS